MTLYIREQIRQALNDLRDELYVDLSFALLEPAMSHPWVAEALIGPYFR